MFFFFFDDNSYKLIEFCFKKYIKINMENKYFCDISELLSEIKKSSIMERLTKNSKEIERLYKRKYPTQKEELSIVSELFREMVISGQYLELDYSEAFAILYWCFKYFKNSKTNEEHINEIINELMGFIKNDLQLYNYENYGTIIYDTNSAVIKPIDNVSSYLHALKECSVGSNLYFRGHSKISYRLIPSILRTEKLKKNEHLIYQELIIDCPSEFKGFKRHIDYLVKMQHYGLPTRLLDITRNPLVALYFSCCNNYNNIGEVIVFSADKEKIKYGNSDTVAMISSLPMFSFDEQSEIMESLYYNVDSSTLNRFIYEVQNEKPGFTNKINCHDLDSCFVVLPPKDNNRMIKQDGAFIICGINSMLEKEINDKLRMEINGKKVLFFISEKKKILEELDLLSINESSLFPEIDHVSKYITSKYSE